MHEAALFQAAQPAPVYILNLRMRPYSLGHELILHHRGNPLISPDEAAINKLNDEEKISAIIQAADICSMTWAQNQWKPSGWLQVIRWSLTYRKWNRKIKNADWHAEIVNWLNYRADGMSCFDAELPKTSTSSVRYVGAPEPLRLYQFLLQNIPESERAHHCRQSAGLPATAWDFPFGLARMHYQAHAESEGNLDIYSWHNKVFDDYVKRREAEKAAEAEKEEKPDA